MRKITLMIFLFTISLGFSQQVKVLEDFEGSPVVSFGNGDGSATVVDDPATNGTNGKVLRIVTAAMQAPWQQGEITLQGDLLQLTEDKTIKADVYSVDPYDVLARVEPGIGTGNVSAADASHPGGGWATLTFDFNNPKDGQGVANGTYSRVIFFNLWDSSANGGAGGWSVNNGESTVTTSHVDNITGVGVPRPETCNDGIQNQDETGVDCGGVCSACDPEPTSLPGDPTDMTNGNGVADADVLSIFTEDGAFTNSYATDFSFGDEFRSDIDLMIGGQTNKIIKLDLDAGGWGAGNNTELNLTAAGFTHFNFSYYLPTFDPGTEGHLIQASLTSRTPGQAQDDDAFYNITVNASDENSNAVLVFDDWVHMSIPLTEFSPNFNPNNLLLFKFGTPSTAFSKVVYLDNIFFSKSGVTLSTQGVEIEGLSTYPNPTRNDWNIRTSNDIITSVEIYNILGRRVLVQNNNEKEISISTQGLASGMYLAKINTGIGSRTVKLIKE